MQPECIPINALPGTTRLFNAVAGLHAASAAGLDENFLRECYPTPAFGDGWMRRAQELNSGKTFTPEHRARLADLLTDQNKNWGADAAVLANLELLRSGANAVVTGQQVTLFGGPLMVLLKAATAVRLAQNATAAGQPHVPIFWLASEDHDFAEINHVSLPGKHALETLSITEDPADAAVPVGRRLLGDSVLTALDQARYLLGHAPICDALAAAYTPGTTLADAFARFMHHAFAGTGLIIIDASTRDFHSLGAPALRCAITNAAELHTAVKARSTALEQSGLHAQVAVQESSSLLFLIEEKTGARVALRRSGQDWRAATENYSTADLLHILDTTPERLSANALLRPVFQDTLLPTSVYIGGPAEVAYFAQSQVVYQHLLGRTTPVLPRLSATLVEQGQSHIMDRYGLSLTDLFTTPDDLAHKLGARAMPVDGKRKLAAAGNSLDDNLTALTEWMHSLDENLGRSGDVAASKMRYQMNRMRRLAANFEVQRSNSLAKHIAQLALHLYPQQTLQERVIGGAWFLARYGDGLAQLLIEQSALECPGHKVILL